MSGQVSTVATLFPMHNRKYGSEKQVKYSDNFVFYNYMFGIQTVTFLDVSYTCISSTPSFFAVLKVCIVPVYSET